MSDLNEYIIVNESIIRGSFFIGTLFIMAILEYLIPKKSLLLSKSKRWLNNLILVTFNTFLLKLIFSSSAILVALYVTKHQIGLLNSFNISFFVHLLLSIILLDLIIYWQHRLFHSISFLWKFHKVHHSDMDYDVTTGVRFHPVEIILSMLIKIIAIYLLGASVFAVILFEVILSALSLFNHSNIKLSQNTDRFIRFFIVTPDMHRIHHSIHNEELNSNYGFNLSIWDRVFKSYIPKPKDGYEKMTIGLKEFYDEHKTISIFNILKLPFRKE